ncbi:PAS domain S-box protein [Mucilaginibacter sp.]|uniref:sensor histidine kinase n=1 Tax=Mucilaginibacter sp. TaxID=1882438 RepID=UPI003D0D547A
MEDIKTLREQLARSNRREQELELRLAKLIDPEKDKAISDELEESQARLKMAIESTHLGTWEYNPGDDKLIWSDECRKIYGFAPDDEITFKIFLDHIYPEDKLFVEQEIQKCLEPAGNRLYDLTFRIVRLDTIEVRWVKAQGKVYFKNDHPERFIGTVIDITDSRLAEEKNSRLVAIIESSDDAIISKTLHGIVTTWNESATRTFGYTPEEMIGQSIIKLIPADRQEEEPQILSRLTNGERVEHFETIRLTKDGNFLNVSLTISPIKDSQGKIIGLSKIVRDITEKKQEDIRKNDFIAMVSHELKTPLTSMKSYVQVLLAKAKKDGDPFTITALTRADVQAQKMTTMIHDFLSLARLEDGKIALNKERFDLHPLIKETAHDAQYLSSNHHVQLKDCEDINIYADRDKIGQVLMNLLSNAIKYSPKGGNIIIGCEKMAGKVKVYISDEGVGISEFDKKRLFERFFRSKNEKIRTVSGFGIGLFLVSEILRYHDSKIEVESQENKGSTFYFILDAKIS